MEPTLVDLMPIGTDGTMYYGEFKTISNNPFPPEKTQNINFTSNPFGDNHIAVIPMIQSRNGGQLPNMRIWNISATGFAYHLDEFIGGNIQLKSTDGTKQNYKSIRSLDSTGDSGEPSRTPYHQWEHVSFIAFVKPTAS